MYMKFMSDYTVGHKNIYLEFPSFMGFLQKNNQKPNLRSLFIQVGIYMHSFTVSESKLVSSVMFTLINYRWFALLIAANVPWNHLFSRRVKGIKRGGIAFFLGWINFKSIFV